MTVAREPPAEGAARDPMINRAVVEADRGVRGRILYVRFACLDGTKIMKIIFGYILHTVGNESQSGKRAWWSTRMKMMRGKA